MIDRLTSKDRMLGSIEGREVDYIPCSFMLFFNMTNKFGKVESIEVEVNLGLDAVVNVGTLEHSFSRGINIKEWKDNENGTVYFYRNIETPAGELNQKIIQRNNWPDKDHFPIFDDYIIPRAKEVLVKPEEDLEKLKYFFGSINRREIEKLKEEAAISKKIAEKHGLLQVAGEIGRNLFNEKKYSLIMGADAMSWLSGFENIMILSLSKPEIIEEYAKIINDWNMRQIEVYLSHTNVDLIVRRGWYETTEFWTPEIYKKIIAPTIKKEAGLIHQAGKKYGYIITSAFLPIVDSILDTGIDVLIGIDPIEGKGTDLDIIKEKFLNKKRALWGGVSGSVTIENGTELEVEEATKKALELLGKNGGFILSPVDNVREETKNVWRNTYKFIETWKNFRR